MKVGHKAQNLSAELGFDRNPSLLVNQSVFGVQHSDESWWQVGGRDRSLQWYREVNC